MGIPRPPIGTAGLDTTFGQEWGRVINEAGGDQLQGGGRILFPDGWRRDEVCALDIVGPGYGRTADQDIAKLYGSMHRAANCGRRRIVVAFTGSRNLANQSFFAAHPSLLCTQTQKPWVANTIVVPGYRCTNDGKTYWCITGGTTSAASPPTGGGTGALVTEPTGVVWRCVAIGIHDRNNPDKEYMCGDGGPNPDGVVHPEGIVPQIFRRLLIDRTRVTYRGYSTGAGMGDTLIRWFAKYITHAILVSGDGPVDGSGFNFATPTQHSSVWSISGDLDNQVPHEDDLIAPYRSTAAIPPCLGNANSLHNLATSAAGPTQTGVLTNTGQTFNYTAVAGSETQQWKYPVPVVDQFGNTIDYRFYKMIGEGHNASFTDAAFLLFPTNADYNPRV